MINTGFLGENQAQDLQSCVESSFRRFFMMVAST
jgi:hypothetical protein